MHKIKLNNCKLNLVKNSQTEFRVVNKIAQNSDIKQLYIIYATVVGYTSLRWSLSWSSLHVRCNYPLQDSVVSGVLSYSQVMTNWGRLYKNFGFFKTKWTAYDGMVQSSDVSCEFKRTLVSSRLTQSLFMTITGWGFFDIQNNEGQGGGYQPKPKALIILDITKTKSSNWQQATKSVQTWNDFRNRSNQFFLACCRHWIRSLNTDYIKDISIEESPSSLVTYRHSIKTFWYLYR